MEEATVNLHMVIEASLDVVTQIFLLLASWLDWLFTEHLLLGNIVSAALLLGLADLSIQTLEIFVMGSRAKYERMRNYHSIQVGLVLGVFNHLWYAFLESYLHGSGLSVVFKKIALDQAVAGPFFSSAFLVGMGVLEGKSTHEVYEEWSEKFIHIYMVDWMFWPLAQFINFHLVPYRFRVFYVNFATFLWNTFLCYAKHQSDQMIRGRQSDRAVPVNYHRIPRGDAERNSSRSNASRGYSIPLPMSRSRRKHLAYTSVKQRLTKSKLRPAAHRIEAIKPPSKPVSDSSGTLNSIFSIKNILPGFGSSPNLELSSTDHQEDWWITGDCSQKLTKSLIGASGSTSGSSINTNVGSTASRSTITEAPMLAAGEILPKRCLNRPIVREMSRSSVADVKKPSCGQSMPVKRKLTSGPLQSMRSRISAGKKTPTNPETTVAAGSVVTRKFCAPQSRAAVGTTTAPYRGYPISRPTRTTVQAVEEVRTALQELTDLVLKGQRELKDGLADTQAQVARLQELCAVTYVSVDDGTRDLAEKADQLASWVQMERKLEIGQIRTTMEEVLATKHQ